MSAKSIVKEPAPRDLANALRRQHQLGAVNKATRELINAQCHDDLLNIIQQLCCSLGASGFVFLQGPHFRGVRKIAAGLPRNQIRTLSALLCGDDKIAAHDHLFAFRYRDFKLVIHHQGPAPEQHSPIQDDSIQDDMALFLDSAEIWLNKHEALLQTETLIKHQLNDFQQALLLDRQSLGSKRDLIVNKMLTDMATLLPMLGLEADQEDDIYDAITPIIEAMSQTLDSHTRSNLDLFAIVENLLHHLRGNADHRAPAQPDDIVLF